MSEISGRMIEDTDRGPLRIRDELLALPEGMERERGRRDMLIRRTDEVKRRIEISRKPSSDPRALAGQLLRMMERGEDTDAYLDALDATITAIERERAEDFRNREDLAFLLEDLPAALADSATQREYEKIREKNGEMASWLRDGGVFGSELKGNEERVIGYRKQFIQRRAFWTREQLKKFLAGYEEDLDDGE